MTATPAIVDTNVLVSGLLTGAGPLLASPPADTSVLNRRDYRELADDF